MNKKIVIFFFVNFVFISTSFSAIQKTYADGSTINASGGLNYKFKKSISSTNGIKLEKAILNKMESLIEMHDLMIENFENKDNLSKSEQTKKNNLKISKFKKKYDSYRKMEEALIKIINATNKKAVLSKTGNPGLVLRNDSGNFESPLGLAKKELADGTVISKNSNIGVKVSTATLGNSTTGSMQNNLALKGIDLQGELTKEEIKNNLDLKKVNLLKYKATLNSQEMEELDQSITNSTYAKETATKK